MPRNSDQVASSSPETLSIPAAQGSRALCYNSTEALVSLPPHPTRPSHPSHTHTCTHSDESPISWQVIIINVKYQLGKSGIIRSHSLFIFISCSAPHPTFGLSHLATPQVPGSQAELKQMSDPSKISFMLYPGPQMRPEKCL